MPVALQYVSTDEWLAIVREHQSWYIFKECRQSSGTEPAAETKSAVCVLENGQIGGRPRKSSAVTMRRAFEREAGKCRMLSVCLVPSRLGTTLHCAVWRRLLCIRPGHISLFLYNQINLKCLQPDLWNARSSWRISEQHTSNFGINATLYILIFLRFLLSLKRFCAATGVTTNPRIQKKERGGGGFKTVHYSSRD